MTEEQWVLFDGGPEDGEYRPVPVGDGRLPRRVEVPEFLPEGTVWSAGPALRRVHVYELVDAVLGADRPVYRYVDEDA